ncbi:MAG: ROK family protein [Chloroflexi bacterium]|nr:ROK family protein [Chloroflexota bacterium]
MSRSERYAAIDLGGTKVRAIVADLDGQIYGEDIRLSRASEGLAATTDTMVACLEAACVAAGVNTADIKGLGIASPGAVDAYNGVVPEAPQLPGWRDVPIVEIMSKRLGVPVWLENDANAAALGENRFGAGKGAKNMLYMTVSTGVGGGIIIDGDLYRGTRGAAGELGHMIIDYDGPPCGCGGNGCLESLISGTAIAKEGERLIDAGKAPELTKLRDAEGAVTAEMMNRAVKAGDEAVAEYADRVGMYLGVALASYVNIFNPSVIVIGGGVSQSGEMFMDQAVATMKRKAMRAPLADVTVKLGQLQDRAGTLGMIARLKAAVEDGD